MELLIEILRVTAKLLENCTDPGHYNSLEYLFPLLSMENSQVLLHTLRILVAHLGTSHGGWPLDGSSYATLSHLCKGWGTKEDGFGLYNCVAKDGVVNPVGFPVVNRCVCPWSGITDGTLY